MAVANAADQEQFTCSGPEKRINYIGTESEDGKDVA
jgi:hypothetical protein